MDGNGGDRPVSISTLHNGHTQAEFDEKYNRVEKTQSTCCEALRQACQCSTTCLASCIRRNLPFIPFLASYKLKSYLFRDLLSGICIGFMGVPQSLGYARIAKVPEIMGLYTSVFPVFVYFFFTSAKHVSLGTIAIVSLVIRSSLEKITLPSEVMLNSANTTMLNDTTFMESLHQADEQAIIVFSASFCCSASIILILMSFLKLGFIASFMSEAFTSAFLASAMIKILLYQFKDMLGVSPLKKHNGAFEFFFNSYEIFKECPNANLVGFAMAIITLNLLLFFKYYVNDKFKRKFKFPIPVEIIIVIVAIFCNRGLNLETTYKMEVLTSIKPGFPTLVVPSPTLMYQHVFDAFLGAIVAYLIVGMMSKLFSHKYGYEVDADQEMFALGISALLGSFFSILLPSTAPARCFLMESTGGKTQACHLFTAAFSLFTMLVFATFMRDLPVCVLASIIIAALVPIGRYFFDPFHLYKTNKYDLMIWMVTFIANMIFTVQEGMVIGIAFSMVVVHVWMLKEARGSVLGKHSNGLFLDLEIYPRHEDDTEENQGLHCAMAKAVKQGQIFIFKFEAPIYFSTLDSFKTLLFSKIPSPSMLKKEGAQLAKMKKKLLKKKLKEENGLPKENDLVTSYNVSKKQGVTLNMQGATLSDPDTDEEVFLNDEKFTPSKLKCVILDFSAVTFMDTHSAKSIAFLHQEYDKYGVVVQVAACNLSVSNLLYDVKECQTIVKGHMYPTVPDAFIASFAIHQSSSSRDV